LRSVYCMPTKCILHWLTMAVVYQPVSSEHCVVWCKADGYSNRRAVWWWMCPCMCMLQLINWLIDIIMQACGWATRRSTLSWCDTAIERVMLRLMISLLPTSNWGVSLVSRYSCCCCLTTTDVLAKTLSCVCNYQHECTTDSKLNSLRNFVDFYWELAPTRLHITRMSFWHSPPSQNEAGFNMLGQK